MQFTNVLEADPSLLESSLRIVKDAPDDGILEAVMKGDVDTVQQAMDKSQAVRVITPKPGVCIKLLTLIQAQKFFINLCQSDAIPEPDPITAEALITQLNSPDHATYRIPMSISELHQCPHNDTTVQCCDIVIHPKFFVKSQAEELFGDFLIQVMIEAIDAKYGIQLDGGKCVVLKNRRQMGTLKRHRIQNREIDAVREEASKRQQQQAKAEANRMRLPQPGDGGESNSASLNRQRRPLIEELPLQALAASPDSADETAINWRLVLAADRCSLRAEFYLPQVLDPEEIQLDVGADCIRVHVPRLSVHMGGFVEYWIDETAPVKSEWRADKELLIVHAPILSSGL